jgi:hypothetical protein
MKKNGIQPKTAKYVREMMGRSNLPRKLGNPIEYVIPASDMPSLSHA